MTLSMTTQPTAILFDRSVQQGRLELTGRDRFDLLHRMSTNDFTRIEPGQGRVTVLTTANARIIDRVVVYHRGESALMITNYTGMVQAWLQRHIFFRDQVKLRDVSAEWGQLELHGTGAAAIVDQLVPNVSSLSLHHFAENADHTLLIAPTVPLLVQGYILLAPMALLTDLSQQLASQTGVVIGDADRYEYLRIAAGIPGANHELTEDYIPLEANLWEAVSFSKGCYIGQEIIARMESRNKLAKTLVTLKLSGEAVPGAIITDGSSPIGTLTSVASSDNAIRAIGFIKPDHALPGTILTIPRDGNTPLRVEVMTAPLIELRGSRA